MSTQQPPPPTRSLDAMAFDLVLITFTAALVINSFGLRPGVGTVPLLVGIPTLAGALVILFQDLFPRIRLSKEPPTAGAPAGLPADALSLRGLLTAAGEEGEDGADLSLSGVERRRQLAFAAWTTAFVILAAMTSFYIAVPVSLVVLLAAIRLRPVAIVLVVGGTMLTFYLLFDLFLRVRL